VEPPPLPTHVQLEVTGACNLRCRMCLVRYAPAVSRREGALSFEQYLSVVDALPGLERLTLQGLGEPLLSPHLEAMVEHAARRGVAVGFNTNGVLLDRERAAALVAAGLGWLHVSLDGATAATYEAIRHGPALAPRPGQFDRVVANLRALVAARGAAGAGAPRIVLVCVAMRRNVDELPALAELAASIGVDELWVQNLSHTFSDTDLAGAYAAMRAFAAEEALFGDGAAAAPPAFAVAREVADRHGLCLRLPDTEAAPAAPTPAGAPGCSWPFDSAYVTHRGDVQPCCMVMGSDRARLGSLREQSFAEIWRGPAYAAFRRALASPDPPEVCRGCSLYRGVF
jgi:radical SAM protein with 4Fe4S-binding SPASM domain